METSTVAESEVNNVEVGADLSSKEESVNNEVESTVEEVNNVPELTQSDKSATSDKELSWEKIAAEFTEDEEEDIKPPENPPPEAQPEPPTNPPPSEVSNSDPPVNSIQEEITEEAVIVTENATESKEKIVEEVAPSEEQTEPLVENVELSQEPSEDDSGKEPPLLEETVEEPPPKQAEEVIEEETHVEEVVEITELKPEEAEAEVSSVAETDDSVEYTVIETEEVETNEIIEEHIAQTNSNTETVVIINPDQSQTEITIEQVEDEDKIDDGDSQVYPEEVYLVKDSEGSLDDPVEEHEPEVKEVKPKKQRGRKPISDIPLHVLGRDITKPSEGVSNGGRTMPKPRLGVKVPYRNLTSQIVSKEEIEKEIMERFKLKQEQNAASSGDILFARKLTQRLAKKLIPSEREKSPLKLAEPTTSVVSPIQTQTESEIKNNSDLIAILEGEGDDIQLTNQKEAKSPISKNTEKEIALQQLKELPVTKSKFFKSRSEEEKKPQSSPGKTPQQASPPAKTHIEKKGQQEMEPRLKTGMVIKTYTRKRKSSDLETLLPPKKSVVVAATTIKSEDGPPTNVYITKSSRIIKRKVIWDPDEVPNKSPIKSPKSETSTPKSPVKVTKPETPPSKTVEKIVEKKIPVPIKKPISKSPPPKKLKQRLSEVDRLLMDEGAVNMLYDVKTNDDSNQDKLKKKNNNKNVISLDKAHKELMSKANVIKNDLQQNTNKEVQKSLRKKETGSTPSPPKKEQPSPKKDAAAAVTRKKSKDSVRSSVHSPPASPSYNTAEASRIIRRHSSSSFSSNDEMDEENGEERMTRKKSAVAAESPKKKLKKGNEGKSTKEVAKNNNNTVTEPKDNKSFNQYKTFTATKKNKLVSIKLSKVDSKHYFTEQVLKDLTNCIKELGKDDECHVVSLTSDSNGAFCDGLDYRCLVGDDDSIRKKKATELASLVKEFLRCLLNFPKVLVAGIQGDCVGLGVTMLPLFDMVVASDTSTFSTPYARLGCIPEAGFLLTVPHLSSHGLASELLYTSQVIKADDAFRKGLVTRLCWPEKYHEELKAMLSQVASQPRQSIMATKQQLRHHLLQSTESSINSMTKILVEHWTSPECQRNFLK